MAWRLSEAILCQNVEKNLFVAGYPGEIVIGFVKKVPGEEEESYLFENSAIFSRSTLQFLGLSLKNIAKALAGKKTRVENEEYDCSDSILQRKRTSLFVKSKIDGSYTKFDLSRPNIFQSFCDALFGVIFAIVLPSNNQFVAFCQANLFFRETFPNQTVLSETALESVTKKLDLSGPLQHYLTRNFVIVQFAYTMSTLANTK